MAGWTIVAVVAIVFGCLVSIIKMSLEYAERIERIKHGYPLNEDFKIEDDNKDEYVDYTQKGNSNNY